MRGGVRRMGESEVRWRQKVKVRSREGGEC